MLDYLLADLQVTSLGFISDMRTIITALATMFFAASAFGAIEFSEDQVAATASTDAGAATTTAGRSGLVVAAASNSGAATAPNAAAAAMAQTMSTGAAGSVGSTVGLIVPRAPHVLAATSTLAGGGGGGGSNLQGPVPADAGLDATDSTGGAVVAVAVSLPEPSTMVVWSVLGLLGLVALRRRK